jgi:GDPmannose 4,6-dehydratase
MLQQDEPDDYVIATGKQYTVREFINIAAEKLQMSITWKGEGVDEKAVLAETGKVIVAVDPRYFRPTEVETLLGDPSKAKRKLGWVPRISLEELITEMVEKDLTIARKDHLCLTHGFSTYDFKE